MTGQYPKTLTKFFVTIGLKTPTLLVFLLLAAAVLSLLPPRVAQAASPGGNGTLTVEIRIQGQWHLVGELAFDKYLTERQLDLTHLDLPNPIWVRISHTGDTAAHIDLVLLAGVTPRTVYNSAEETTLALKKVAVRDYDVIDVKEKSLVFVFNRPSSITPPREETSTFLSLGEGLRRRAKFLKSPTLSLTARIEPERISQTPFQFPLDNLYQIMRPDSAFYTYAWDSQPGHLTIDGNLAGEQLSQPFFKAFSKTGSGHPSDYTYAWLRNDADTLYVALDFVPDNTMDGDKDYAIVYLNTPAGLRHFKASVPQQQWGQPGFVYTPRAIYQHKVYEFAIPLSELGLTNLTSGEKLELAFAAYGTATPTDLSLTKSVTPTIAAPGDTITYTLTFSNSGQTTAKGVVITDSIPVSVTHSSLSSSNSGATITPTGSISYVWSVENLSENDSGIITISGILSGNLSAGTFTNTATITTTTPNDNISNNTASVGITTIQPDIYLPIILKN